jgi:TPR repeat protein
MQRVKTALSAALLGLLFVLVLISNASAQSVMEMNELSNIGEGGDSAAQFELGNRYLNGTGVLQDTLKHFAGLPWQLRRRTRMRNTILQ